MEIKQKQFDLFSTGCGFTDDSVMTTAISEALLAAECLYDSIKNREVARATVSAVYMARNGSSKEVICVAWQG